MGKSKRFLFGFMCQLLNHRLCHVLQDRIIMGAERKTSFVSEEVKKMTAYHEVGALRFVVSVSQSF